MQVDHINFNRLDNRKCNLRICTLLENSRSKRKIVKSVSKYKGVTFPNQKVWMAKIRVNRKTLTLGSFKTEREAGLAYNAGAIRHFGEFAVLNVIED